MIGAGKIFEFYCEVVDYNRKDYTVGDIMLFRSAGSHT